MSNGDGRALINLLELVGSWKDNGTVDAHDLKTKLSQRAANYDKKAMSIII